MATVNKTKKLTPVYTFEGGKASHISKEEMLARSVLSCLLNEDTFYEDGESIKDRIKNLIMEVDSDYVVELMLKAKNEYFLRHVPLYMYICLTEKANKTKSLKDKLASKYDRLYNIINRVDDMAEVLALYWEKEKRPIPRQMLKGISKSFEKFDEYQFGKYKGTKKAISLKDVMMLTHPKASSEERNALYKRVVDNSLAIPLTWETELSAGKDKKEVFTRLLSEKKLGALALLRNLRNMESAQVDMNLIADSINNMKVKGIMPYNFYTANKYSCDHYRKQLEAKMIESASQTFEKLKGLTLFLIDTSGSMDSKMSAKGDVTRAEVAGSLAAIIDNVSEFSEVFTFNDVPHKQTATGFELINNCSCPMGATNVCRSINMAIYSISRKPDRIIVITDEQTSRYYDLDHLANDIKRKYIINVAPYQNGIEYDNFIHINGFSDAIFKYIAEYEKMF